MDGNDAQSVPNISDAIYTERNFKHRWQGDIFATGDFTRLPESLHGGIGHWMVMNRTCHMLEDGSRKVKIPNLVFCPVLPLETHLVKGKGAPKLSNQISNLVAGKSENLAFLPSGTVSDIGLEAEYVVDLGAVLTQRTDTCPPASAKLAQLSSPFAEHLMQRFARYYATIGYDDESLRDKTYRDSLVEKYTK